MYYHRVCYLGIRGLIVERILYTHHGLYIGDNQVIHYLREEGVKIASLDEFSEGQKITKREYSQCFDADKAILRAKSRLDETDYSLFLNNCEHFVSWCKTGNSESQQVKESSKELYDLLGISNDMQTTLLSLTSLFENQQIFGLDKKSESMQQEMNQIPAAKLSSKELEQLIALGEEVAQELEQTMGNIETFFDDLQSEIDSW